MDRYIETEMITSIATIILVIFCIAVFILYGGSELFYAVVAVTLVVGLTNAWLVAKGGKRLEAAQKAEAPKKRRRTKRQR